MAHSNTSNKPTILFVPGTFHTPAHFQPIMSQLKGYSYPSLTVSLPSMDPHLASISDVQADILAIRSKLMMLTTEKCRDVILVMHSYGAVPGCQAIRGLEKPKWVAFGQKGGVIHCVFVASSMVAQDGDALSTLGGGLPPWVFADVSSLQTHLVLFS